ncbi:hypothetical protein P9A16_31740 [Shinella sp. 838]|uniref:hypothetical protein n=1 Tax=Shinella sp. 838 TaxID=3038164 RepID=UPI00241510FF|nr:hypothetical protein [Shinella sp. 838]MDG4675675.1 hypothetical protein [Shinella sp. 838]
MLDDNQLQRILSAVEKAGGTIPPSLQVRAHLGSLAEDIEHAFNVYEMHSAFFSDASARIRRAELTAMRKNAVELAERLDVAKLGALAAAVKSHLHSHGIEVIAAAENMRQFAKSIESAISDLDRMSLGEKAPLEKGATAQAALLTRLAGIYERHFKAAARAVYLDRIIDGPFVAFIEQAYTEASTEKPPKRGAIQQALVRAGLGNKTKTP